MSKLIIVCGLPGSGKTMLASELSKRTKIACIHKDSIKECLFEKLGYSTLEESKKLGKPSVATLFRLAEEQIKNSVDIIIESPFNFTEDYQLFEIWKNKYGVDIYVIVCFVDEYERKKRFYTRERHHAHYDTDRQYERTFDQEEFDYSGIPGEHIKISTNRPIEELIKEVISKIG